MDRRRKRRPASFPPLTQAGRAAGGRGKRSQGDGGDSQREDEERERKEKKKKGSQLDVGSADETNKTCQEACTLSVHKQFTCKVTRKIKNCST